jgi:hypothetical protein
MFVSLEPLSGNYVDVYPENAQNLLKKMRNNEKVFLGPDCFNAIVHRKDDSYFQKTPSVFQINKRGGMRSVKKIANADEIIVCFNGKTWNFVKSSVSKKITNIKFPPENIHWQWCNINSFHKATDLDWISYSASDNMLIENAFEDHAQKSIQLPIGMKTYEIIFLLDEFEQRSVYAIQKDVNSERKRIIRRSLSSMTIFPVPENETTCALCCEDFKDSTHLPWIKTACHHVFHCVCFDRIRAEKKCPMCRTQLY